MALKNRVDMLHGSLQKNIILFTLPIIATSLLQLLFNTADLLVVAQFGGENSAAAVAAIGSTGSLTTLLVNFFMGLSVGVSVTVAQGMGADDQARVHRIVHTAIPLAALCGAVLTVVGVLGAETFLRWMGNPEETLALATLYIRIYFGGMIANLVYNFGAAILRAAGDTVRPLLFLTAAGVLNVILNVIFVTCFQMTVDGVSLATVLSQCLSAVLILCALSRRKDACNLRWKELRIHRKPLGQILYLGVPAGIQSSMFSIANVIIQSSVNSFGAAAMAGSAAAGTVEGYVYVCQNAFYQAAINFTGQNMGAGNPRRIRKILLVCAINVVVVGLTLGCLMYAFGEPLLRLFLKEGSEAISIPAALEFGMVKLFWVGVLYFVCGLQEVMTGVLRGIGCSISSMVISIVGVCGVRLVWIFTAFRAHSDDPAWLFVSYVISWAITFLAGFCVYLYQSRRMLRKNTES